MNPRLALLTLLLSSCSLFSPVKDGAVHHLLEPLAPERTLVASVPAIAVSRASLPSYLDDEQLVTRRDDVLVVSNHDLWAEPLDVGISRVMASNLSRLTGSMNIQPVERFATLDYSKLLELRISQFEPDATNAMVLQGTWKLQPVTGKEADSRFFRISVPIKAGSTSMTDRVEAMNQALLKLSREVAAAK